MIPDGRDGDDFFEVCCDMPCFRGGAESIFTCDGYRQIQARSLVAFMFGQFITGFNMVYLRSHQLRNIALEKVSTPSLIVSRLLYN